ncbi:unnamed protein product, partial [Ectocarpus sp. 8 AP-2014]
RSRAGRGRTYPIPGVAAGRKPARREGQRENPDEVGESHRCDGRVGVRASGSVGSRGDVLFSPAGVGRRARAFVGRDVAGSCGGVVRDEGVVFLWGERWAGRSSLEG